MADVVIFPATAAQVSTLAKLGVDDFQGDRSAASAEITRLLGMRANAPATEKQRAKIGAMGGKDLPGAGLREASTAIAILELLAVLGTDFELVGDEGEVAAINNLLVYLRERFVK